MYNDDTIINILLSAIAKLSIEQAFNCVHWSTEHIRIQFWTRIRDVDNV